MIPKGLTISVPTAMFWQFKMIAYAARVKKLGEVITNGHWMFFGKSLRTEKLDANDKKNGSVIAAQPMLIAAFTKGKAIGLQGAWRYDGYTGQAKQGKKVLIPDWHNAFPGDGFYRSVDSRKIVFDTEGEILCHDFCREGDLGYFSADDMTITFPTKPSNKDDIPDRAPDAAMELSYFAAVAKMGGHMWINAKSYLEPIIVTAADGTVVGMIMPMRM